jgi:uncharacterized alkaline shock family protein YloU
VEVEIDTGGSSDLAAGIRRTVIAALERMTGLELVQVNVTVHDVHVPDHDDQPAQTATRAE